MPVLYKIDDNDSDKVLKDKLRKILDNLSHQISNSDGSIQSVNAIISNITSNNGGSVGLVNHAFTHESGGQDEIKLDNLGAPDDNTDLDASTSAHGLLKKLSNVVTEFLNGQGSFSVPDHDALTNFVANEHLPGIDEDNMVSNSDAHVPTQQSVKAYVDASGGAWDGDIADINLDGGTDIGADLTDADLILVDDGAGGTNRKCALSRLKTYLIGAGLVFSIINSWDSLITPDITISPIVNEEITWS